MGQKGKCRQDQKPQPFPQGKVGGAEGCRQKRDLRNRNLQQEARRERQQHQSVSQMIHTENRLFHVPHADGVKKLGHAKDRKGIGLRPAQYRLVLKDHGEGGRRKGDPSLPHDSIRNRKEGGQADACDQQAIETGAGKAAVRKQAFLRISRRLFHQAVRVIVVGSQRQGRKGVGDQVAYG